MVKIDTAVILAAGLGSRLKPLTDTMPKCLIEVKGKSILLNTLDHLSSVGVKEAVILVGYLAEMIKEKVGEFYQGLKIRYIENEIYDKTNNMYSLWLAKDYLKHGVILIEGDSFFEKEVLRRVLNPDDRSYWAADRFDSFKDGCMLTSNENGAITRIEIIRRKGNEESFYGENNHKSGDVLKITPQFGEMFSEWLDQEVQQGNVNIYYDLVLAKHLSDAQIFICNINGLRWMEIDNYNDLRAAEKIFSNSAGSFEMKYEIVPIERLKPLERVFPHHLENLNHLILREGIVKAPILADRNTGIVLDGSHRYIFFLMHGYKTVPVHFIDYNDENIRVGTHLVHRHLINEPTQISKSEVVQRGLSGNLFPARTTRHFFPFRKMDNINVPLSNLEKGSPVDVSRHIEKVTAEHEIEHNQGFIKEVEQEVDEVINYLYEAQQVKEYLKYQIEEMKKSL